MRTVESEVEQATFVWLESSGWAKKNGLGIVHGKLFAGRECCRQVLVAGRLWKAIRTLNPRIPSPRVLVEGVAVDHRRAERTIAGDYVRLIDSESLGDKDWLAVNQMTNGLRRA